MHSVPESWSTPKDSSLLGRLLARRARHPDEFDCAVRVVRGTLPGESVRWRYRRSAVDPYVPEWGVITMVHGDVTLRLRLIGVRRPGDGMLRRGHLVHAATELSSSADVEIAVDTADAARMGIEV